MTEHVEGMGALQRRLAAIDPAKTGLPMMQRLGLAAVREQKLMAPRKTSNLSRSIHVGEVTPTSVQTYVSANYASAVEFGTKPHDIVPRLKKALRFAANAGGARLTGSVRSGAAAVFAMRVRHPGTKAQPFMVPGAKKAIQTAGLTDIVVAEWNKAA